MNLVTIVDRNWTKTHFPRWLRYARAAMPDAKLYVICTDAAYREMSDGITARPSGPHDGEREWYNRARMGACGMFGVAPMLYVDCDADIYSDLRDADSATGEKELGYALSPVTHPSWPETVRQAKLDPAESKWTANNGFLFMRRDFLKEWDDTVDFAAKMKFPSRTQGITIFNLMLRRNPGLAAELPMKFSTIWWDMQRIHDALCLQYCNAEGQRKRLNLEMLHLATRGRTAQRKDGDE